MITKRDENSRIFSSKDPSGFLFYQNGVLFRQINSNYKRHCEHFMRSGLYEKLVSLKLIIPHREVNKRYRKESLAYKIICPKPIPFISYPYEWCFSQLKDAALTTLKIQKIALAYGMNLKDATPFNIQFVDGKPQHIDTLSFELYQEGKPWVAYRQFCQLFLAPLALITYKDVRLAQLLYLYPEGLPLNLVSKLLPSYSYFLPSLFLHIHLHAKSYKFVTDKLKHKTKDSMSRLSLIGLIESLESAVLNLTWKKKEQWEYYYCDSSYTAKAFAHKKEIVSRYLKNVHQGRVLDLGANTGVFSRLSAERKLNTISLDSNPKVVELNYLRCVKDNESHIMPLIKDITYLIPSLGWETAEYLPLTDRLVSDVILMLALVHHLIIGRNIPMDQLVLLLNRLCRKYLIIEFIPKSDNKVRKMLTFRQDIFSQYSENHFLKEFSKYFVMRDKQPIVQSQRIIYYFQKK